jgi:hypothetical protein
LGTCWLRDLVEEGIVIFSVLVAYPQVKKLILNLDSLPHAFQLVSEKKTWTFSVHSASEKLAWMDSIQSAINILVENNEKLMTQRISTIVTADEPVVSLAYKSAQKPR